MTTQKAIQFLSHLKALRKDSLTKYKLATTERGKELEAQCLAEDKEMFEFIERALQPQIPEWQPIETAPKDIPILVFTNDGRTYVDVLDCKPDIETHWIPLPAAPKDTK